MTRALADVENKIEECSACGWKTPVGLHLELPRVGDTVDVALHRMRTFLRFTCPECEMTEFKVTFPHAREL